MKRYVILLIASLFAINAAAQQVIASAGGWYDLSAIKLSWTLGETIIPSYGPVNGLILAHGFQSGLRTVIVEENIETPIKINVYPNPATDVLTITFAEPLDNEVTIYLFDSQGRLVKTEVIEASTTDHQLVLENLQSGIYLMKLIKGKQSNVYKVIKL